jgi:hypothetical protein
MAEHYLSIADVLASKGQWRGYGPATGLVLFVSLHPSTFAFPNLYFTSGV